MERSTRYEYCKVFVRCEEPVRIASVIAEADSGGSFSGTTVDVHRADDWDANVASADFVFWPTIIDIESDSTVASAQVVELVNAVLKALRTAGFDVVAACDFEDELL